MKDEGEMVGYISLDSTQDISWTKLGITREGTTSLKANVRPGVAPAA